jgi:excisionase family DNA binding protein
MAEPPENFLDALVAQPSLVHKLDDADSRTALQQIAERASALKALESQIISRLVFDRSQSAQSNFPHLLTAKQLAEHLAVPESWVREQARIGKLPSIKLGHYVRFRLDDIERYFSTEQLVPPENFDQIRKMMWLQSNDSTIKLVLVELADVLTAWTTVLWAHAVHENGFFSRLKRRLRSTSPKPSSK